MVSGTFVRYALHTGGGWSGHLVVADGDDIEKSIAPAAHVKRMKAQEIRVTAAQGHVVFPWSDGSPKHEGHTVL